MNIVAIDIDEAVDAEVDRQIELWGEQNHPDGTSVDNKGVADAARAACEEAFRNGHGTWKDIALEEFMEALAEEDEEALVKELIQSMAVTKSWIQSIQRRLAVTV